MIDLSDAGFGENTLDLGNGYGFSAELKYEIRASDRGKVQLGIQATTWDFGRSNTKTISNGSGVITITEPDSTTTQAIFYAGYVQRI